MKKIVVIGSKPNAVIPDGDTIYCANASIAYYGDHIARFRHVVNLVIPVVVDCQAKRTIPGEQEFYRKRCEMMLKTRPTQLIILSDSGEAVRVIDSLRKVGYDVPIMSINNHDRRKLVAKVSGFDDPILTADFFYLPKKLKVKYARFAADIILKRLFDQTRKCNPIFRPSTGIISLLYAIDKHGPECNYVVAGIGLKNRNDFIQGNLSGNPIPHHVFADHKILRKIASKYKITSTEPELMGLLPPFTNGSNAEDDLTL